MDRKIKWRTFWLALITVVAVLTLIPSAVPSEKLPTWFSNVFNKKIQLGLDLQGGLHTVYSIDLDKAVDDRATAIKRGIELQLSDVAVEGKVSTPRRPRGAITIVVERPGDLAKLGDNFFSDYDEIVVPLDCPPELPADRSRCVRVSSDEAERIRQSALEQAIRTVRERIDERGVAEPTVIMKGSSIVVELPGLDKQAIGRVKELIERTAKLEFKIVHEDAEFMKSVYSHVGRQGDAGDPAEPEAARLGIRADNEVWVHDETGRRYQDYFLYAEDRTEFLDPAEAEKRGCFGRDKAEIGGKIECRIAGRIILEEYLEQLAASNEKLKIDDDHQWGYELINPERGSDRNPYWRTYYLYRDVEIQGTDVSKATVGFNPTTNRPEVLVDFTRWGGRKFAELTAKNVGRKMAIILDNKVNSAPTIQTRIDGGRSSITMGGGTQEYQQREAEDLVNVLRTGSLPAPLKEESSSEVGPLLGQDAIDKAVVAFGLAALLVIVIMCSYYRVSGVLSISALTLNILFMMALLAAFGATLTLPGIAAIVLTIGMAVDANIIVYERIREELRTGKSVKGSVDAGFSHGFSAVLDGQLTTAVAAYVLYQFGSGPIRGFAVMLMIGIVCTLFTALWCTRLFFEYYIGRGRKAPTIAI
jgi:preprotein translocase subunit SecD